MLCDHRLGRNQEACDRRSALYNVPHNLRGVDDAVTWKANGPFRPFGVMPEGQLFFRSG